MSTFTAVLILIAISRIGTLMIGVYVVGVILHIYEYLMQLSAYYDSRATALMLATRSNEHHAALFASFATVLSAEKIAFSKQPPTPVEQVTDLLKNVKGLTEKEKKE
jgi:uncharacterized membrane protein